MRRTIPWLGIGLVGVGVVWESVLAPSAVGWGLVLVGFVALLLAERLSPLRTPLDWPILLLAGMGGISLLVTALPQVTRVQVMRLGAGLAGFYGLINWARERNRLLWAATALVIGGAMLALLAPVVVDWNRTKPLLIPPSVYESFPLLVSDAAHPNIMAALMVLLLPLPLALLIPPPGPSRPDPERRGKPFALGAAALPMGIVLLLTKSRGGYIAAAVGSLLVAWLSGRKWWALALTLASTGLVLWLLIATAGQAPELVEGATDPGTWDFRQRVWRVALWMIADFPFTGAGMGTFNHVASLLYALLETENPSAHNLYLQIGADLGIPGLIATLTTLTLTLWMALTARRALARNGDGELRALATGTLAGLVALMVHGLVDVTVWNTRAAFVPWLVIGLVAGLYRWSALHHTAVNSPQTPASRPEKTP